MHRTRLVMFLVVMLLPFAVFFWMTPFVGPYILDNDYIDFPIQHQMELLFSLRMGTFPLYVPGFDGGQSALALTMGQLFHPISHLSSLMPAYWQGKALEWNTLFRLLSLGLAHGALFMFLGRLGVRTGAAFVVSTVTVYNMRMLDLFRYGASLESWTGMLFLCASIGWYYLKSSKIVGPLSMIVATYLLVCSGHPQMMFYGLVGSGIWMLLVPFFSDMMTGEQNSDWKRIGGFWFQSSLCIIAGIALSALFILPFYTDFLLNNIERSVMSGYAWADGFRDTFMGTVNNFFQPFLSDVHGAFAGSSLFLAAMLVPVARIFKFRIPAVIWGAWVVCLLAFLHMQGSRLPLYYLAWKYLPFAHSFRIAGRISMIMPLFMMMILAWTMQASAKTIYFGGRKVVVSVCSIAGTAALLLMALYLITPNRIVTDYTVFCPITIKKIPSFVPKTVFIAGVGVLITLTLSGLNSARPRIRKWLMATVCLLTIFQIIPVMAYGTWVTHKRNTPTGAEMLAWKQERTEYRFSPGGGLYDKNVFLHVKNLPLEPYLAKIYGKYVSVDNSRHAYAVMAQGRSPDCIVLEGIGGREPQNDTTLRNDTVQLLYNSYNRLLFDITASRPGIFGLSYPYSGNWRAFVSNKPAQIFRANGYAQAIFIPGGKTRVVFEYWSNAAFYGLVISCSMAVLIGLGLGLRSRKRMWRLLIPGISFLLAAGVFTAWYNSLYSGKSIEMKYSWTTSMNGSGLNRAYWRMTAMSSIIKNENPHLYCSGRAVDGSRQRFSGCVTAQETAPWWQVDLAQPLSIGKVLVYAGAFDSTWNKLPLTIDVSNNGIAWQAVPVKPQIVDSCATFSILPPVNARFVRINTAGLGSLAFDEVEIFPPDDKATARQKAIR